jgi:signal transduction histidine kinase
MKPLDLTPELLAEITHDFRSPLNGIIGFAALLHEGKLGSLSADQAECMADILTSAQELVRLVDEVSDLGKLESGALTLRPERVDLAGLIREVCVSLQALSGSKRVEVTQDVQPGLASVVVDPVRLKQILTGCGAQSVKTTPEGGRVTVRATTHDAERFRIEIEDTSTRPKDQPEGLGLVLSRRLAELHGGALGLRTTALAGSAFVIILPRAVEVRRAG